MVKEFEAHFIDSQSDHLDLEKLSLLINQFPIQKIDNLLWSNNFYFPEVSFCMAYTHNSIIVKYFVKEQYIRAIYKQINDLVYKDSCVELFISLDGSGNYYNLEFNCAGTPYAAYGNAQGERALLPVSVVKKMGILSIVHPEVAGLTQWELTLQIPFEVFIYNHISDLNGKECRLNLYKCGDELPMPHYLSWSNITASEPNFHVPAYFGRVLFR